MKYSTATTNEEFKKGDIKNFLDYQIKYCTNNDGIVLMKHPDRPQEGYECHLGNYSTLDSAQQAAIIYFMLARPNDFANCLLHKVMRNGSGTVHEYYIMIDVLKREGIEVPEELMLSTDGMNCMIGYKGDKITWEKSKK